MIFYVLDVNGKFLLSDGKGLQEIGLRPGQVVGMSAYELYQSHPDIIEAIERAYRGENCKYDHELNGYFLENYVAPYYNEAGNIAGIVGATIDCTERHLNEVELAKANALSAALIESAPGIMYLYNENGELVFWNKSHETITGYSAEELQNFPLMNWYLDDPVSQEAVTKGLENTLKTGFGQAEATLRCKDGTKKPMYFTASPVIIDGKNYFVGVGVDITTRINAENKLQELNHTLEDKIQLRTQELQDSNEELAIANEELLATNQQLTTMQSYLVESEKMAALGGLVAGVAHEVNTPIGIGLTASSHLTDIASELLTLREQRPLTDEDIAKFLEDIEKASQIIYKNLNRAANLVQSFKKLSVDQCTEPRREFDIGAYIDEILLSLSPSLKKSQIKIEMIYPEKIFVNGYPGSIAQIITNLVMNSIKHAYRPGDYGIIQIEITRKDAMIQIRFQDDGIGMDEHTLSKIYDPFFTTNRSGGGTGLGLSIVYSIVTQQYEGSIKCTSQPGKGTAFIIEIKGEVK